jgi:hypothetical protein
VVPYLVVAAHGGLEGEEEDLQVALLHELGRLLHVPVVEIIANFEWSYSLALFWLSFLPIFARILKAPRLGLPEFLSNGSSMNWALKLWLCPLLNQLEFSLDVLLRNLRNLLT